MVDRADRCRFLRTAARIFTETRTACLAWALMTNHLHLLLRTGDVPISLVMQRLLTSHAVAFNRRHERVGHLFQNRFHSRRVEFDEYLLTCVRYIHRNPLEAGTVRGMRALEYYPWTGHGELMGTVPPRLIDVDYVLVQFGADVEGARGALREFMARDDDDVIAPPGGTVLPLSPRARMEAQTLGVRSIAARTVDIEAAVARLESIAARREAARALGWTIERIVSLMCRRLAVDEGEVISGQRSPAVVEARASAAYLACECLGVTQTAAARRLGVSQQAVAACIRRARRSSSWLSAELQRQPSD